MELLQAKLVAICILGLGALFSGLLPSCIFARGRQRCPLLLSALLCFGGGVLLATSLNHILPEAREAMPQLARYAELIFCGGFFLLYALDECSHLIVGLHKDNGVSSTSHHHNHNYHGHSIGNYGSIDENRHILEQRQPPSNPEFTQNCTESPETTAPSQLCHVGHQQPCEQNYGVTVGLGLIGALSIHSLLEGLVVGLAKTPNNVLLLLGAISSHKFVVGFSLGAELVGNSFNSCTRNFFNILVFALGSVLGIMVGMLISNLPQEATELVIPVLQCLAGGTLLYVTVSEVLPRERARWHQQHRRKFAGIVQFLSVSVGFTFMTLLGIFLDN